MTILTIHKLGDVRCLHYITYLNYFATHYYYIILFNLGILSYR